MSGQVYLCSWKKVSKGFKVWLKSNQEINVISQDLEDATEVLSEKIGDKTGDREAILEFLPLLPVQLRQKKWLSHSIVALGFNEFAPTNIREAGMYQGGFCPTCGNAIGLRTEKPISIRTVIKGDIAATADSAPAVLLLSADLVSLLCGGKSKFLQFRAANSEVKQREFFELVGLPLAPFVSFRGANYNPITCWKCRKCGHRNLHPTHVACSGLGINEFIASSDLPRSIPRCFVIGDARQGLSLCMTKAAWSAISGENGTAGVTTNPVGTVSDKLVDRDPKLRSL